MCKGTNKSFNIQVFGNKMSIFANFLCVIVSIFANFICLKVSTFANLLFKKYNKQPNETATNNRKLYLIVLKECFFAEIFGGN